MHAKIFVLGLSASREKSVSVVNAYPINVNMQAVQAEPVANLAIVLMILVQALIVVMEASAEKANVYLVVLMCHVVLENAAKMAHALVIVVAV